MRHNPPDSWALCPLIGTIERVEVIEGKARLKIKDDVIAEAVIAHSNCHHAYGLFHGLENMPDCPLYIKDINIAAGPDGSIEITSTDDGTAVEIRRRSRSHVVD